MEVGVHPVQTVRRRRVSYPVERLLSPISSETKRKGTASVWIHPGYPTVCGLDPAYRHDKEYSKGCSRTVRGYAGYPTVTKTECQILVDAPLCSLDGSIENEVTRYRMGRRRNPPSEPVVTATSPLFSDNCTALAHTAMRKYKPSFRIMFHPDRSATAIPCPPP